MKKNILFIAVYFIVFAAFAQNGKLLIIGGGSERSQANAWNAAAYKWAVDKSPNKKVAIVSYDDADTWLEEYFENDCGAEEATNIKINTKSVADNQTTYDQLKEYSVVFFKGGDQYRYYSFYKDTKTQQAVEEIYNDGGVICGTSAGMAILSSVMFTAKDGSVYPAECVEDPNLSYIQLANDFFNFCPGYLFDTHFAERGRLARLVGMMGNWKINNNENVIGIGIDDMTAMAIDENKIGTVFGTGAANIITPLNDNSFNVSNGMLIADNVILSQVIQGGTYDFNSGAIAGLTEAVTPEVLEETGAFTVIASGSDSPNSNKPMMENFIKNHRDASEPVVIVTGTNTSNAETFKSLCAINGATDIHIISATATNADSQEYYDKIKDVKKILFVGNNVNDLKSFISGGKAGEILNEKITQDYSVSAFVGEDSRFAGKKVINGYKTSGASYYGELTFDDGMGLLQTAIILPNTYYDKDMYENSITGVPYTMVKFGLKHGIWLTEKNFMVYTNDNSKSYVTAYGNAPVMMLRHEGSNTGFSVQTSKGDGSQTPRMIAGFEKMNLYLIDETMKIEMGNNLVYTGIADLIFDNKPKVWQNTPDELKINWTQESFNVLIFNIKGQKVISRNNLFNESSLNIQELKSGVYLIKIEDLNTKKCIIEKIIVN